MEEPWDELMGPSPEDLKNMLRNEERQSPSRPPPPRPDAPVLRGTQSSAPPPSAMFSQFTASRSSSVREGLQISASAVLPTSGSPQPPRSNSKRSSLAFEDEEPSDEANDPDRIRAEALKVLGVAEDRDYSVPRTGAPGEKGKRVRTALSGLSFTTNRVNNARSPTYRDDPYVETEEPSVSVTREDYEYGDEGLVDVIGMERRSMASRAGSTADTTASSSRSSKNWSSRYSVDNTLLAMSGGAASQRRFLDSMDRQNDRQTARNLFGGKSSPQVFGSGGFSFRKNKVFGKQNVAVKPPSNNLQTVWMDMDANASMPPANHRSKSWQEQLQQKRNQRRRYIALVLVAFCLTVTLASVLGVRGHKESSSSSSSSAVSTAHTPGSVTFYVTADAPYDSEAEQRLQSDLQALSPQASMFVHVGNLQDSSVTLCQPSRYGDVADLLKQSPVPAFVLPGEEDVSNCPDPAAALDAWEKEFIFFHRHFIHNLNVMEEEHQYQNFAVIHQGVLFLGMHIAGGVVHDEEELNARNQYNYMWVYGMCEQYEDDVRAVVLFGNARPGEPVNREFFVRLGSFLGGYQKPVAYVHANAAMAGSTEAYQPFKGIDHVMAVQVGSGVDNPPLRMNVGFGDRPFIIG